LIKNYLLLGQPHNRHPMPQEQQKTKVLHIITQLELGGAQKHVLSVLARLDNERYNKYLATSSGGILLEEAQKIPQLNLLLLPFFRRRIAPAEDLLTILQLIRYIKRNKIEIVHTHSSKAGILGRWAARFAKTQVIIHTVHGWSFHDYLNPAVKIFYILLERITSGFTNRLIAVSQKDIQAGLNNRIGKESKYSLIRYGLDQNEFCDARVDSWYKKEDLGLDNDSLVIGMVACFKPQKNPLDFIKAARIILQSQPKARFILVGDGALRPRIEKAIKENDLEKKIFLLGWRNDVNRILPLFDVVVLTSLWEGLPIVFLEAMACAKPIVAYNVGGVAEIIKERANGFLVKAGEVKALSLKVTRLLKDPSLRQRMGWKGKTFISDKMFSVDFMVQRIEEIYRRTLKD